MKAPLDISQETLAGNDRHHAFPRQLIYEQIQGGCDLSNMTTSSQFAALS
jgi:hypothetical protein